MKGVAFELEYLLIHSHKKRASIRFILSFSGWDAERAP